MEGVADRVPDLAIRQIDHLRVCLVNHAHCHQRRQDVLYLLVGHFAILCQTVRYLLSLDLGGGPILSIVGRALSVRCMTKLSLGKLGLVCLQPVAELQVCPQYGHVQALVTEDEQQGEHFHRQVRAVVAQ